MPYPRTVRLGLHSYSCELLFRHQRGFDAFAFVERAARLGMAGVHISINGPNYRWAGGMDPGRLRAVGEAVRAQGMFLETDTSGTDPAHLGTIIEAARYLDADTVRTYTRHGGDPEAQLAATVRDLKAAAPLFADAGLRLVLENHEEFIGAEVRRILDAVGHPAVGALYDFANSMMVGEEPMEAARAMAPHTRSIHLKDHVVAEASLGGGRAPEIYGVPIGRGNVAIGPILDHLLTNAPLERVCVECVWGYHAPMRRGLDVFEALVKTNPTFRPVASDEPGYLMLDARTLLAENPTRLFNLQESAVAYGVATVQGLLAGMGYRPTAERGVYTRDAA